MEQALGTRAEAARSVSRVIAYLALLGAWLGVAASGLPALPILAAQAGPGGVHSTAVPPGRVQIHLAPVVRGLVSPVGLANAGDGSGRLFVIEQTGRIRVLAKGRIAGRAYLDLRARVSSGDERGLLGLAFHPRFERNGVFVAAYTDRAGDLRISRFRTSPRAATAPPGSEQLLLSVRHRRYANHNGGQLAFGPDGYLYIGTGDGGGAGDPAGNAQNRTRLLGKVLRIDVDHRSGGRRYAIPAGNPYARSRTLRREILHYGLRNPWRFSFDRRGGNLWLGDVGQADQEEIDRIPRGRVGLNLGWDCREGNLDTSRSYGGAYCRGQRFTRPLAVYRLAGDRCAVIGGYVYRGRRYARVLGGMYVYGDYCSGELFGITHLGGNRYVSGRVGRTSAELTSFGESEAGELYATGQEGALYRVTARRR
jgi:glucose/arabinose dehydrogenase